MALKELQIRNIHPTDKVTQCTDERGLYLEVHPNGSKLWRYKYRYMGKQKRLALGRYPEVGLATQVSPHVMARPGELRMAEWSEFDLEGAVWKIPAERMKMRRPHEVPLSRQVLAYLSELFALTGPEGYVFPAFHTSKRPLSENTVNQAFRRMGYAAGK